MANNNPNNDSKNAQYYILKGECLAKSGDAQAGLQALRRPRPQLRRAESAGAAAGTVALLLRV